MDLSESLTQFCQLTPELSDLVLGFRIGRTNRKPSLNMLSYDLCRKFGTRSFVQCLPILPGPDLGDTVKADSSALN